MACEDADAASAALLAALSGPAEVTVDGNTVRQQPIEGLIKAHKYLAGQCAGSNPRRGIRFTKLVPPGGE